MENNIPRTGSSAAVDVTGKAGEQEKPTAIINTLIRKKRNLWKVHFSE
ncbi:hypothetical protein [Mixta gaviniae]|nr:hypothetical protein [Mixta gaviniae]